MWSIDQSSIQFDCNKQRPRACFFWGNWRFSLYRQKIAVKVLILTHGSSVVVPHASLIPQVFCQALQISVIIGLGCPLLFSMISKDEGNLQPQWPDQAIELRGRGHDERTALPRSALGTRVLPWILGFSLSSGRTFLQAISSYWLIAKINRSHLGSSQSIVYWGRVAGPSTSRYFSYEWNSWPTHQFLG